MIDRDLLWVDQNYISCGILLLSKFKIERNTEEIKFTLLMKLKKTKQNVRDKL